ncbi:MAG: hypothetical protein HYZ48_01440 [Chlamydiales bacterium]|nr:hypothetical protein [Chlamydiales bacterium]
MQTIILSSGKEDDLHWEKPREQARKSLQVGEGIIWEIDWKWEDSSWDFQDPTLFQGCALALEIFSAQIYPEFIENTKGVILLKAKGSWLQRKDPDLIVDYVHQLIRFLPDEVMPIAHIDLDFPLSLAETTLFLSERRFDHLKLIVSGGFFPFFPSTPEELLLRDAGKMASIGVCLPRQEFTSPAFFSRLEVLLERLIGLNSAFRLICEERLPQSWNGLDRLILFPDLVSVQGKRMVQGFSIAGGEIVEEGAFLQEN